MNLNDMKKEWEKIVARGKEPKARINSDLIDRSYRIASAWCRSLISGIVLSPNAIHTLHCPATQSHRSPLRSVEIPPAPPRPRRFGASQGVPSITAGSSVA